MTKTTILEEQKQRMEKFINGMVRTINPDLEFSEEQMRTVRFLRESLPEFINQIRKQDQEDFEKEMEEEFDKGFNECLKIIKEKNSHTNN